MAKSKKTIITAKLTKLIKIKHYENDIKKRNKRQ
jgi:hypothetical protein